MYSYGPPDMAKQMQDDQLEHTCSSYVRIREVAVKTCQRRWTIGRSGERGSGISVLAVRHDDDHHHQIEKHQAIIEYMDSISRNSSALMTNKPTKWNDANKKHTYLNGWPKERPQWSKNTPKQLQTNNVPTHDVENTNVKKKGKGLLLANKPWIIPWGTERIL